MSLSTSSKCLRLSKTHEPDTEPIDIKSSLRDTGCKNYMEQDEDSMSDYGPAPRKKLKISPSITSERKLSLRGQQNSTPCKESTPSVATDFITPKRKYHKRDSKVFGQSDRKLRNQTSVESNCCGQADPNRPSKPSSPNPVFNETKVVKKSRTRRLTSSSNHDPTTTLSSPKVKLTTCAMPTANGKTSMKAKSELSKPKVIDHISQSVEINIECPALNLPKNSSSELKKSNNSVAQAETMSSKRSNTLSQKHSENNGGACVSHTTRNSLSHHGKLCRKSKKTTIYHDSNGWLTSKSYWSADYEFWDISYFANGPDKNLKTQQDIEIPSFREKKYTPLYKIEGTEDLSDHVFEKRHLPYEIMEKKIKKNFLIQSKYELQKSKYLKNNELLYKKESFLTKKFPKLLELTPNPLEVKKIDIVPEVPVMAFGVPVKLTGTDEFSYTGITE